MVQLNAPAPDFTLGAIASGQARRVRLSDFRGRWVVLFFYPADFTFVCPTELRGFQAPRDSVCECLGILRRQLRGALFLPRVDNRPGFLDPIRHYLGLAIAASLAHVLQPPRPHQRA